MLISEMFFQSVLSHFGCSFSSRTRFKNTNSPEKQTKGEVGLRQAEPIINIKKTSQAWTGLTDTNCAVQDKSVAAATTHIDRLTSTASVTCEHLPRHNRTRPVLSLRQIDTRVQPGQILGVRVV